MYVEQNIKFMKKTVGCFEHGKMVFLGILFFEVLMLMWCLFGVSGIVPKVLKMIFFPVWGAFVGWVIFVYLGLEGLGVLVFLCLFFFVLVLFLFVCYVKNKEKRRTPQKVFSKKGLMDKK